MSHCRSRITLLNGFLTALCLATAACSVYTPAVEPRPAGWAQPIEHEELPNLHRVSKDLYRCAKLDKEGYDLANEKGIRTIINLRPNKASASPVGEIPNYVNIPVHTGAPTYDQAREFFRVVDDPKNQPVLLHCYHGADRTGAFTALYRINREGWSKDEAIREMTGGGYKFHTMWKSLIEWVQNAPEF